MGYQINKEKTKSALKELTKEGCDEDALKTLKITKAGYSAYIKEEIDLNFSLVARISHQIDKDFCEFLLVS